MQNIWLRDGLTSRSFFFRTPLRKNNAGHRGLVTNAQLLPKLHNLSMIDGMKEIVVVGGGPAGCMAAIAAADAAKDACMKVNITLLEQNEKLGKKLYITGKGRCNLTNAGDRDDFFAKVNRNPKFLYSAYSGCPEEEVMQFFEGENVPLKTERGNRVFPESDKSSDIIRCLEKALWERKVDVRLHEKVRELRTFDGRVRSVKTDKRKIEADAVILATGGVSYATTGADGSGFTIARTLGHGLITPVPALAPLITEESFVKELAGLTLKNITATLLEGERIRFSEFGELLFTHTGVSGPVILSGESVIARDLQEGKKFTLKIDLKSALDEKTLDERLLREIGETPNQAVKSLMQRLLPKSLCPFVAAQAKVSEQKPLHDLTKEERQALIRALKGFTLTVMGSAGFSEAIITCGGIPVKEVNPKTMESKKVEGLYFAGELLDCDAMTGGYNLQIAWSTGALAGSSAALKII